MFRDGTNQKAVYEWLSGFSVGESREFNVDDVRRPGDKINDVMARTYISAQSKIIGFRFKTKTIIDESGIARMHVTRTK